MVRSFDDPENRHRPHRALQIYQILIGLAHNRQTITYGGLGKILEFSGAGVFAQTLELIAEWCRRNRLPELNVLVVGKGGGSPGDGATRQDFDLERERVYGIEWYRVLPPTIADLST